MLCVVSKAITMCDQAEISRNNCVVCIWKESVVALKVKVSPDSILIKCLPEEPAVILDVIGVVVFSYFPFLVAGGLDFILVFIWPTQNQIPRLYSYSLRSYNLKFSISFFE